MKPAFKKVSSVIGGEGATFGFGMLIWIVILGVIVWAVVRATSWNSPSAGTRSAASQSTREILDARLARGEVTVEEYKKLRETIEVR